MLLPICVRVIFICCFQPFGSCVFFLSVFQVTLSVYERHFFSLHQTKIKQNETHIAKQQCRQSEIEALRFFFLLRIFNMNFFLSLEPLVFFHIIELVSFALCYHCCNIKYKSVRPCIAHHSAYQLSGTRVKFINVLINNVCLLRDNAVIFTNDRREKKAANHGTADDNRKLLKAKLLLLSTNNTCSNSKHDK